MLISRVWLSELLGGDLPDDATLRATITSLGLEVEGTTVHGGAVGDVVVGRVLQRRPHPQAERLTLVTIEAGRGPTPVVCGAPNVPEPGGCVAFAPVGAVLPGGFAIEGREIRGERSEGMICSEQELDIGGDGDGILVLPADWTPGDRLVDRIPGIADSVFELSITPNRPDALGHVGVARDLAVKLGRDFTAPSVALPEVASAPDLVTLQAPDRCGRYFGYALEGAAVGTSPPWLRVRLHRLGLRAINDVVDITNLVLMEWGQPLHAFDRDKLEGGRVIVRRAAAGESIETLDGQKLELDPDDLVIADAAHPQALAGVMGGLRSGVEPGAQRLLLEAAWFSPAPIRVSARRHQIATDSSYRFERGVDYGEGLRAACARALQLLVELTGASVVAAHEATGEVPSVPTIRLRPARTEKILGMAIPDAQARRILAGLGVEVDATDPAAWSCRPPTGRPDLAREEDLVEELMRHHGLDELQPRLSVPTGTTAIAPTAHRDPAGSLARRGVDRLVDALAATGLHETVSLAFADPEKTRRVVGDAADRAVALDNPMRQQSAELRMHLLPGLLDAAVLNAARHGHGVRLFEVGRTYAWGDAGLAAAPRAPDDDASGPTRTIDDRLPVERLVAGVLVRPRAGQEAGHAVVAAMLDTLARLGLAARVVSIGGHGDAVAWLHPGIAARLQIDGDVVGVAGELHPDLAAAWELDGAVGYGELWVDRLPPLRPSSYTALPRFPASARDVSIDLDDGVSAGQVVDLLVAEDARHAEGEGVADPPRLGRGDRGFGAIEVVEEYRGEGVSAGRRALLLRLHYRAADRSVTDTEVQTHHDAVVQAALVRIHALDPAARRR